MKNSFRGAVPALVFLSLVLIGCAQAPAPVSAYGVSAGAGSAGVHTVTTGENLWSISNRYNIVMRDIVISNNLSAPFVLSTGQRIRLPAPRTHRVREGDSLYTISRLYGVSASEVARLNDLSPPYVIPRGQVLKLPGVTPKTAPAVIRKASVVRPEVKPDVPSPVPNVERGQVLEPEAAVVTPPRKPERTARVQPASAGARAKIPSRTPARSSSKFLRPINGKVISGYGPKKGGLHNDGINIRAARGTAVRSAENGVVVYAGSELKGSGNLILVRHADRWMTAYAHLDEMKVARGQVLKRGEVIGTVGSTGSVDSPQLHFEVRRGTDAINPTRYLESL